MRALSIGLLLLLALVQGGLWFGANGVPQVRRLQVQLDSLERQNADTRRNNERLAAEVQDLRQGLEMVEERARSELGMVKPDELFVHYSGKP